MSFLGVLSSANVMRVVSCSGVLSLILWGANACDAREQGLEKTVPTHDSFSRGAIDFEVLAGAFFSVDSGRPRRPTINTATESFRFGIMLSDPHGSGLLAGNAELLLEALAGQIFTGPGSTICGGSAILRYNFLHPQARIVPYFQLGMGGAYNDIVDNESQALIGSEWQVLLKSDLGLRVRLNERLSLMVESGVLHLSNAGSTERNHGLNCLGGMAGVAVSF